jgi:hypothetical protein
MSSSGGTNKSGLVKSGPATQECKEVVRWNAICHGISLEVSTGPSMSWRPSSSGAGVALLPWPGWTWMDCRVA